MPSSERVLQAPLLLSKETHICSEEEVRLFTYDAKRTRIFFGRARASVHILRYNLLGDYSFKHLAQFGAKKALGKRH